jgi:hypothetical protein
MGSLIITTEQLMTIALGAMLLGASASGLIILMLMGSRYERKLERLQTELDSLKSRLDIELVTVTLHDSVSGDFIETKRFGDDLYSALAYCQLYNSQYDLFLKVRKASGEYISLNLINNSLSIG